MRKLSFSSLSSLFHSTLVFCLALGWSVLCAVPAWPSGPGKYLGDLTLAPTDPNPKAGNNNHTAGEPVDLSTGLFVYTKTDLVLPDILPLTLTRTYRTNDTRSRSFGIGATHAYDLMLVGDGTYCMTADLILPDGSRVRYTRTTGSNCSNAVLEHATTPTRFFKSRMVRDPNTPYVKWLITLTDGTVYRFSPRFTGPGTDVTKLLEAITDANGNTLTIYTAPEFAGPHRIVTPNGRWVEFTYDTQRRITQAKDNSGRVVTYTYDGSGRLWKVTDPNTPNNGVTEFTYDTAHRMKTIKDAKGIVYLTNDYDTQGRVMKQTQADGGHFDFTYVTGAGGAITQADVTDPRGTLHRVTFNSSGYTLSDTRAVGTPEQQTTVFTRQVGTNFMLTVTDQPLNRTTNYAYDAYGNVTTITRPPGQNGPVITTFEYTAFDPVTFSPPIRLKKITDPLGHPTEFVSDAKGNLRTIRNAFGKETVIVYNAAGQPITITDPEGNTTEFFYEQGDLVRVEDPEGNTTTRFVDAVGRLVSLTAPLGQTTRYAYDLLNRLKTVTDPLGKLTQFAYDSNGNLLKVMDARNGETEYQYNNMDRLEKRIDPLEREETYLYDLNGNLTSFKDRKQQGTPFLTTFLYDGLNRRTKATYQDGATTTYTYDGGSRLRQVVDSQSGTILLEYDELDRLTSEGTPQGTVTYSYDKAGRRLTLGATGQTPANYDYDDLNRLTSVSLYGLVAQYEYDDADRRTKLTLPNGVTIEYGYDQASRLTGLTYKLGASVLGDLTYTYDANGQRTKVGGSFARTNLPDPVSSSTYDLANQILSFDGFTPTYDPNGNLTSLDDDTYGWDVRNRLSALTGPGLSASFQYDALGRRMKKTFNGQPTEFMSDGVNPLQEQAVAGGNWTALTMTGLGIDEILARGDTSGVYYYLPDGLGSTAALTDGMGAIHTEYTYTPFGETTRTGAVNTNPFQFTARENDNTGLYYYKARYYHPVLQRFISQDPIEFRGGDVNLYGYVRNNPLNFIDPLGLDAIYINFDYYPINTGLGFRAPLGHAAVVSVNPATGATRYYEFGRYSGQQCGIVRRMRIPNLTIGSDGLPTQESMQGLYTFLSTHYGKESNVSATYYAASDHQATIDYAERFMRDPHRPCYNLLTNNCKTFARDAANACKEGQICQ